MPAYLLREGEGKAVAIYSRCEDELLCRAELLVMLGEVDARVPPGLARGPVHGYYDVDPTCTREEFLGSYEKDPARQYWGEEGEPALAAAPREWRAGHPPARPPARRQRYACSSTRGSFAWCVRRRLTCW